jgi:thioredoxin reductase
VARVVIIGAGFGGIAATEMQRRLAASVWTGCRSRYRAATGRIVTNWPGMAAKYRRRTRRLRPSDYGRSLE